MCPRTARTSKTLKDIICDSIDNWINTTPGYTTARFAREIGVAYPTVKRWQNHTHAPDIDDIFKICDVMKISPATLLFGGSVARLTPDEDRILQSYRTNADFKQLTDKYLSDTDFESLIKSLMKLSK